MRFKALTSVLVAGLVVFGTVGNSSGAGAPTVLQLTLPAATAFSILGYDCGGITEQSVATGFDTSTGFPTADVYLWTRCSAGGKGGHSVTITAFASATWDLTGALVSDTVLSSAPSPDPTATPSDAHGNGTFTTSAPTTCTTLAWSSCTYIAYLSRAASFVPVPRVTAISASVGAASGGESITISGTGFTGATSVAFGGTAAASFKVVSDTSITAVVPAMQPGPAAITVTSAGGTSLTSSGDVVTLYAQPHVTGISPRAGSDGALTTITITGSHLTGATSVDIGGVTMGVGPVNDSTVTALAPPTYEPAVVDVTVTSPGGTSAASSSDRFVYAPITCSSSSSCESSAHCARLSGAFGGRLTLTACAPHSKRYARAAFRLAGSSMQWSSSAKTTTVFLERPSAAGRGACAAGSTEEDLYGAVDGGTATATSFGDAIHARICVTKRGAASLAPHTSFYL